MYYYPCKPNRLAPESGYFKSLDNDPRWIAEVKKNGWRCLAHREKESLVLYTRHHTLITDPLQEVRNYLFVTLAPDTIIDGELINNRTKDVKGLYYVFDVISASGKLLVDCSLSYRRAVLEKLIRPYPGVVELAAQTITGKKRLYELSIQTSRQRRHRHQAARQQVSRIGDALSPKPTLAQGQGLRVTYSFSPAPMMERVAPSPKPKGRRKPPRHVRGILIRGDTNDERRQGQQETRTEVRGRLRNLHRRRRAGHSSTPSARQATISASTRKPGRKAPHRNEEDPHHPGHPQGCTPEPTAVGPDGAAYAPTGEKTALPCARRTADARIYPVWCAPRRAAAGSVRKHVRRGARHLRQL